MHSGLPLVPGNACLVPALVVACCSREYMQMHVLFPGEPCSRMRALLGVRVSLIQYFVLLCAHA